MSEFQIFSTCTFVTDHFDKKYLAALFDSFHIQQNTLFNSRTLEDDSRVFNRIYLPEISVEKFLVNTKDETFKPSYTKSVVYHEKRDRIHRT